MVTRERRVHPVIRTVNNDRWITARCRSIPQDNNLA
jgi:hypothetical protein